MPAPDDSAQPFRLMATLPFFLKGAWTSTGQHLGSVLPWYALSSLAMEGHPVGEPKQKEVKIAFEWPLPYWTVAGGPLAKGTLEKLHLQRYCTDRLYVDGVLPYEDLTTGDDPPDFSARLPDGSQVGVDVTQLAVAGRIAAQVQFEQVQAAILDCSLSNLSHLRGHFLYMWFTDPSGDGRPHRQSESVAKTLAALRAYRPDTSWANEPMPPPGTKAKSDVQAVSNGCRFYAVELRDAVPASAFYEATGFELVLAYQSTHNVNAALKELRRLVDKHDKPEIQHLVVTVGGPKANGVAYPSESILFDAGIQAGYPRLEPAPRHLTKVVIHLWRDGRIIEVFPKPLAWEPIYKGGYGPPHYALIEKKVPLRFELGQR